MSSQIYFIAIFGQMNRKINHSTAHILLIKKWSLIINFDLHGGANRYMQFYSFEQYAVIPNEILCE